MDLEKNDRIDARIESALRGESLRDAPLDFHRRVEARVRIVALLDRERRRFKRAGLGLAMALGACVVLGGAFWLARDLSDVLFQAVPGAMGHYDHLAGAVARNWQTLGASSVAVCIALVAGLYWAERALRNRMAGAA